MGSLTGVVASQSVTEAFKGALSTNGNRALSVMTKGRLTVRPTSRAGTKVGHSDPVVPYGRAIAQRIKGTPDNRLIVLKSSYRRSGLAFRCWFVIFWGWRRS